MRVARPFIASRERRELPHISIGDAFPDSPSWDSLPGTEAGVDEGDNIAMRYIEIEGKDIPVSSPPHTNLSIIAHRPITHPSKPSPITHPSKPSRICGQVDEQTGFHVSKSGSAPVLTWMMNHLGVPDAHCRRSIHDHVVLIQFGSGAQVRSPRPS